MRIPNYDTAEEDSNYRRLYPYMSSNSFRMLMCQRRIWTNSLDAVGYTDNGRTDLTLGESSEEHGLAARHSLLNARSTESLSLVSRTVNQ